MSETLAINGGQPVRTRPFPSEGKVGKEELKELVDVIDSGAMNRWGGTKVVAFEEEFADIHGAEWSVASTSGTAAIHVAMGMVNPAPGQEIITGPITDMGSIVPILYQGAIPTFAECDAETFNMDPADIEAKITEKTAAIMAIHLFGNPCDMDPIMEIARAHNLPVIEDCSQAHLSEYKGRLVGTIGDIGCFSLQQSKHITCGDGGITITNDEEFGLRGKLFMDKGWHRALYGPRKYEVFGPNYRMNELSGAVALAQTRKLRDIIARRRANGDLLRELVADVPNVRAQKLIEGCKHTYWQFGMRVEEGAPFTADEFAEALKAEGISCGAHYIGRPIFLCHDALRNQRLFGNSHHPFDHPNARPGIKYDDDTTPRTQEVLDRLVQPHCPTQFMSEEDVRDIGAAIRKVAEGLGQ
ncbi:MAG: DegT/DnrJ/EryC1/StrS family aminotransferase [candidate division WS1 bacterium]|jgi:dTDP-4-amino-4,6-dideoxygalactose transaminase|nr:DegT/DnrJ/EryC1/StrS family aminotransferase [candidate division WS1 bacterium]